MRNSIVFLAISVIVALFPLFQGKFYATGDTRDIFIPLETFFHNEMLAGRLPAWNGEISWGFPVIASAQIGFFYPPLLLTRWLPIWLYLPLNLAGHLIALALGTFYFLKSLGRSDSASYLGAVSFTLGAFIVQHLTHLNIIFAIAWFPWQILTASKFVLRSSKGNLALLSLALAIPFLAGQIQIPFLMALVASAYFLYSNHSNAIRRLVSLSAVALLAFGIAAAQLFPTAELAWHSTRGANNDFAIERANQYSWPLYHLPTVLFPRFFGNDDTYWGKPLQIEYGFFIGIIPLLLALSSFGFRHSTLKFWKWLSIISFLLALGSLSPFRLLGIEPSLWLFSSPARWLLFTTFGFSILAAFGWDHLFHTSKVSEGPTPWRWFWVAFSLGILVILFNFSIFHIQPSTFLSFIDTSNPYYSQKIISLFTSIRSSSLSLLSPYTSLTIIILISLPFLLNRRYGKQVLLAATTAELLIVAVTTNPALPWQKVLTPPETINQLPENVRTKQARLYSPRPFESTGKYLTNPESRENSQTRELILQLLSPLIHAQFNLPSVTWPASLDLASEAKVLQNAENIPEELNIGTILHPVGVTRVGIKTLTPKPRAELNDELAEYREITPSHIQVKTNSPEPGELIVRDTFYPGWVATLDDTRRVQIGSTGPNNIFRSVQIPAGEHMIDMHYRPKLLYVGMIISVLSIAGSLFAALNNRR